LTWGPLNSAANYRPVNFALELKKRKINASIISDDRKENLLFSKKVHQKIDINFYSQKTKVLSPFACRKLLYKINPDWVVQTNPSWRAFVAIAFTHFKLIGEWDEPPILRPHNIVQFLPRLFLQKWMEYRANVKISTTKEFRKYLKDSIYLPNGQYIFSKTKKTVQKLNYFAYLGNFYPLWDHDLIILGAHEASIKGYRPKIIIIGDGPDKKKWQLYLEKHNLTNVKLLGYKTLSKALPILEKAKVLLLPMRDTPLNRCRCPSKIFAYMAAGRPILGHAVGEAREILKNYADLIPPGTDLFEKIQNGSFKIRSKTKMLEYKYKNLSKKFIKILHKEKLK